MENLEKPLTKKEQERLHALLSSDKLFGEMLERAVRGKRKVGHGKRDAPEILDRLGTSLRTRVVHASVRSPESLFDELEGLNLVLELRGRIGRAP
jgi:hypothetical protein